jgi:hypothetical protein
MLSKQVEEELNGVTSPMDPIITPTNVTLPNELLSTASLKKKEVETKTSKRKRNWLDKKRKCTKKGGNNKENTTKVCHKKKEQSSKACVKKKGKCSKVSDNTNLCHCIRYKKFQMYLTSWFSRFCSGAANHRSVSRRWRSTPKCMPEPSIFTSARDF